MRWLEPASQETGGTARCRSCTAIDGRHELAEQTLDHLEGYRGSRPVRIGNAAYEQLQLDIYGELMDAVYLYNKYGDPDRLRRLGQDPADPEPRVRRVARARRGDLGGARRPPALRLLEAHVLGGARPRPAPRRQALVPGGPAALAREPRRDLRGDHEPGLEPRAAGLRPGLRQRQPRRRQPDHAARLLRLARRPALPRHPGRDPARPDLGQPRPPLRRRAVPGRPRRRARAPSPCAPSGWSRP